MIDDFHTYTIKVDGYVDQNDINAASPVKMSIDWANKSATVLLAYTDQSGLIGVIRHLHSMGFVLRSVQIKETSKQLAPLRF